MQVTWNTLKTFVDNKQLSVQWVEHEGYYYLTAFDNIFTLSCRIPITDPASDDLTDFIDNYKNNGNKSIKQKVLTEPANIALTLYKAVDVVTVPAGQEVIIDTELQAEGDEVQQILYGGALYADSPGFEDFIQFQIVHPVHGVLKNYVKKAYLNNQNTFEDYDDAGAYLPIGLILRCIYKSTKESGNTKIKIHFLMGIPDNE